MKAQMKKLIDVDDLIERLDTNNVPYCGKEEVPAYVSRMITEYHKLKDKYTKLHRMLAKHEAGTLDFEPTCPIELLEHQADVMSEYLHTLEVRAEIENVKL